MNHPIISESEIEGGIVMEQDSSWPNADILMTESEDAILKFFITESNNVELSEYELCKPYLLSLKKENLFDINQDGVQDSLDAKLIVRYFRGNSGIELIKGLINKNSKRRVANDIINFLDKMTGKQNGVKILENFTKFKSLERLIKHGKNLDSLNPM